MTPADAAARIRVVLAGSGSGGPDRDALAVARALRDAGHEVVLAAGSSPEQVVGTAIQEDADLVVVCAAPGTPTEVIGGLLDEVVHLLAARDASDLVARVFDRATTPHEIADWVAAHVSHQGGG